MNFKNYLLSKDLVYNSILKYNRVTYLLKQFKICNYLQIYPTSSVNIYNVQNKISFLISQKIKSV